MYEDYGTGKRDTYEADKGGLATDIPMAVLVNQYSASSLRNRRWSDPGSCSGSAGGCGDIWEGYRANIGPH